MSSLESFRWDQDTSVHVALMAAGSLTPVLVLAPSARPSGSAWPQTIVRADDFAKGEGKGSIQVALVRDIRSGKTHLDIEVGRPIENADSRGFPISIELRSPDALRALVSAFRELMADPTATQVLATIRADAPDSGTRTPVA
jgi:hypothetical protein